MFWSYDHLQERNIYTSEIRMTDVFLSDVKHRRQVRLTTSVPSVSQLSRQCAILRPLTGIAFTSYI
jgi:hypothetical protein